MQKQRSENSLIRIGDRAIGEGAPSYVIAEMACAHQGESAQAPKLVDAAAKAKADAIQIQIFSADRLASPLISNHKVLKSLEISLSDWAKIIAHAKGLGLHVWANVFDPQAMQLALNENTDAIKLHSSDMSNPPMLDVVSLSAKPISLSTGASTLKEIAAAIKHLRQGTEPDILLMHGYQGYPTAVDDIHLNFIRTLKNTFKCPVGYQDHTEGASPLAVILPLVALGVGACVIEKHITLDRSLKAIDYHASLDPDDFANFVEQVRIVDSSLGKDCEQPLSNAQLEYRRTMKKNIVAARDIKKDETIKNQMIDFLRAGDGLVPTETDKIIDKKANRDISRFEPITLNEIS